MALHSTRSDTFGDLQHGALDVLRTFAWLEDDRRPLDWNGPANRPFTRFRDQELQRPIIEHFDRVACRQRDAIAIREADAGLTFGELWDGVSGLAETLAAETKPGDLIGILLPACPLFPLAMLACLASGHPFVALDTHWPPDWLDDVLRDARPTLIITLEDGLPAERRQGVPGERSIEARMPTLRVIRLTGLPRSARRGWRPATMGVDEPACVLFSSGSTGRPKSIVNSQRNLLQRVAQSMNAAHINTADRLLTLASPCTIVGVRDTMTALLAGASIHLLDPQGVSARETLSVIGAEAITILFAFPALLRSIVAARAGRAETSLRLVRVGGDTTSWSDIETLRAWLPSEAAIQIIYAATEAPMMQWFVDDRFRRDDARVPIGYPLPGNRLALVDEEGRATRAGEVGELIVASPYVSLGRWVDGRLADESVETGGEPGGRIFRIFRTGDLVRQTPDGLLDRLGRKDRQIKIRGSRVDLDGIEARLRGHAFVRDVAAVARPSGADGTMTLVAYVSARDDAPPGLIDELKASLRSAPPPMRPARFYLAPSIPRLPSSKLDIRALAALDEAHVRSERAESIDEAGLAPIAGDHISQTVARVWQHVLLVPVRAAEDDFFDSGGDSLTAITFVIELERALELEISLTLVNEAPRFDQLCQALRERRAPASTPLVTLKPGDGLPPVFFVLALAATSSQSCLRRVAHATCPGAVIGIRARGVVRGEVPHTSVEAMAADYLREIKQRQPNGPYYLCGSSSGGLVAFEMARRLSQSGEEVGLVGLFDTTMSPVRWPLRAWRSIIARRTAVLAAALRATPIRTWPATLRKSIERLRAWRRALGAAPAISIRVTARALIASAKYHPGFYRGQLTLFSPVGREPGLPSLESVWRKHARTVVVVETAGTHRTMLSTLHAETTAACLTRCLPAANPVTSDTGPAQIITCANPGSVLAARRDPSHDFRVSKGSTHQLVG
jgi:acyl-coenzyme A synthetase/AMP-(fatty) acid ligase/thioesterase domain-containing protein/acyl carrier protein